MTIQELGTIFQTQAAVKIVVLNNEFLGMVRQWQQLFFDKRYASTEMVNPDFITIAKGYYLDAKKVDKRENLDAAVAEMIASDKPYFLEVCVEKEDNVFPMIPTGARFLTYVLNNCNQNGENFYHFDLFREQRWLVESHLINFLKRHINIESLTTSRRNQRRFQFIIIVKLQEEGVKLIKQIEKQVDVIRAFYHTDEKLFFKKVLYIK